jgi:hypothetical protein
MPLSAVTPQERHVLAELRKALKQHSSYAVKNQYHKDRRMGEWETEKHRIERFHMTLLKDMIDKREQDEKHAKQEIAEEKRHRKSVIQANRKANKVARAANDAGATRKSTRPTRVVLGCRSRGRSRGRSRR